MPPAPSPFPDPASPALAAPAQARLLAVLGSARDLGLLGPGPLEGQLAHALDFVRALAWGWTRRHPEGTPGIRRLADLGSGGGLPGLVVAVCLPGADLVLVESQDRRAAFLGAACGRLGLDRGVTVLHDRAERAGRSPGLRAAHDVVTARSFGPPPVTAECAAPLLALGGILVVSDPPPDPKKADPGSRWDMDGLAKLGLAPLGRWTGGHGFSMLEQVEPCPDRFPRRVGVPAKRPLF